MLSEDLGKIRCRIIRSVQDLSQAICSVPSDKKDRTPFKEWGRNTINPTTLLGSILLFSSLNNKAAIAGKTTSVLACNLLISSLEYESYYQPI